MAPKFRAWDKEENRWINIASLVFDEEGELWYLSPVMDDFNPVYYENELGKTWEIMQSTGLKDKNDVEIFEGDVVVIKYSEHGYHYYEKIVFENGTFTAGDEDWLYNIKDYCVVCGNIYENPELLEPANEI